MTNFVADPVTALEKLLAHSGMPQPRDICQAALDMVWEDRGEYRFNKGVSGRGRTRFTAGADRAAGTAAGFLSRSGGLEGQAYPAFSFLSGSRAFSSGLRYWPV